MVGVNVVLCNTGIQFGPSYLVWSETVDGRLLVENWPQMAPIRQLAVTMAN